MENQDISIRKTDHIELAFAAQAAAHDNRFDYEPFVNPHPQPDSLPPVPFAGRILRAPIWISSMTGGAGNALKINRNLAAVCKEFGLGMGLGSCRPMLESDEHTADFAIRKFMGDQPLFANLGIAQVEQLLASGKAKLMSELVERLEADGLIVHVNPLQEWLQPEGDKILKSPLETLRQLLSECRFPVIAKEVGQGFGPKSMQELVRLPLEAIDFGAQGGTNFSLLEGMRRNDLQAVQFEPVSHLGHTANEMTEMVRNLIQTPGSEIKARGFIVSGGIRHFLDGYYHISRIPWKSLYGQASAFLKHALEGEYEVMKYAETQVRGLEMAYNYLQPRNTQ